MLRFVFPRLFGSYKEGALIVGKFTVSNSGATLTPVEGDCHPQLTCTGDTGVYTLVLDDGCRKLTVVGQPHVTAGTEGNIRNVHVTSIVASTGTVVLQATNPGTEAAAPAIADLVDTSILTVCLYADK